MGSRERGAPVWGWGWAYYLKEMIRRLASIVALILLLSSAAPVLACVTGSAMSHAESACCRAMHGQCGAMEQQGCCRTEIRTDNAPQFAVAEAGVSVQWVCVAYLPMVVTEERVGLARVWVAPDDESPPGDVSGRTTVLQI